MEEKMNEDFSEVISKFKNILAEKNIEIPSNNNENSNASESSLGFDLDIDTILKIKNMITMAKEKNSPRIELLKALKPFLKQEKQEKLDEYIKIANILTILEILNENRR
jgi:hypothetical protein